MKRAKFGKSLEVKKKKISSDKPDQIPVEAYPVSQAWSQPSAAARP
jgi:hypothetical protein